jgi:hypothetical protein
MEKWQLFFPLSFQLKWKDVWKKQRARKEIGFIWSMWHQTFVVNTWNAKVNHNIQLDCLSCDSLMLELTSFSNALGLKKLGSWCLEFCIVSSCLLVLLAFGKP